MGYPQATGQSSGREHGKVAHHRAQAGMEITRKQNTPRTDSNAMAAALRPTGDSKPTVKERTRQPLSKVDPVLPSAVKAAARWQISEERRKGLKRNGEQISLVPPCPG